MQRRISALAKGDAACERRAARRFPDHLRMLFSSLALPFLVGCVSTQRETPPPDAIRIGTVLPFSGERAASGVALETAMRLAIEIVNSAQGMRGRQLWLDVRDSHSDATRGSANALALINGEPIPFFIGTEEPTIAFQITTAIKSHQMVHLMPGLTSAQFHDPSAQAAWFRLSPSAGYIACALAKHMRAKGVNKANLVLDPDDYSGNFATAFDRTFHVNGGTVLPNINLGAGNGSFADVFSSLSRLSPDATVLVTAPSVAAALLQEWAVRGKPVKWYLGPPLNNPELLRNVPMGVLDGVQGVSADLGDRTSDFEMFFQQRTGVPTLAGSHNYFDAVVLLALAVEEAIAQGGQFPAPLAVKNHMASVTSPGGTVVAFDQIPLAMSLLAAGQKIEYQGAAGFYVLSSLGDSTENRGAIWEITGTQFTNVDYQMCNPAEVDSAAMPQ